jgi:hypothetical protein
VTRAELCDAVYKKVGLSRPECGHLDRVSGVPHSCRGHAYHN